MSLGQWSANIAGRTYNTATTTSGWRAPSSPIGHPFGPHWTFSTIVEGLSRYITKFRCQVCDRPAASLLVELNECIPASQGQKHGTCLVSAIWKHV